MIRLIRDCSGLVCTVGGVALGLVYGVTFVDVVCYALSGACVGVMVQH